MELKHGSKARYFIQASQLLIVPYGIETKHGFAPSGNFVKLLIVPYGIETW